MDKDLEDLKKTHEEFKQLRANLNNDNVQETLEKFIETLSDFSKKIENLKIKENE